MLVILVATNALGYAQDPRVPAGNHILSEELAPAIGRIRNTSNQLICTAWIAQGGVLITAGHCDISGDILEFNVPLNSGSCGELNAAAPEDQYVISTTVASNNQGGGNDWKIFEVQDNPVTGYQPIQAQLKHLNFVKKNIDNISVPTIRLIDHGTDASPNGPCSAGGNRNNSKSGTLQTQTGDNNTSSSTAGKLLLDIDDVFVGGGASGGPMIDENTGEAIGILNTKDDDVEGTTLHRSGLWNAFQTTQTNFTLKVYQKNEAGNDLSGTTVARWDNSVSISRYSNHYF